MAAVPLFGGALCACLQGEWLDASEVRPVPDHQEVWTERHGTRSLIIELLERVEGTPGGAAQTHFDELCEQNGALSSVVLGNREKRGLLHRSVAIAEPARELHGMQDLADGVRLLVHLRLLTLHQKRTDVLISMCRPSSPSTSTEQLQARAMAHLSRTPHLDGCCVGACRLGRVKMQRPLIRC